MLFNAKNCNIQIGNTDMDYISFGKGNKPLIMLPGLGDGLKTAKGTALPFAAAYRQYGENHKVYVFSRKNQLEKDYTTRDMAKDQAVVMRKLGITDADIIGISQGGMIAQYMAIDYPDLVNKLVLAVTLSTQNKVIQQVVHHWIELAKSDDYKGIFIDTAEKSYSEKYIRKYRLLYPILTRLGKPKDFNRFIIQANACITHNAYDELSKINRPTLVIGGDCDKIVGPDSSAEIADKIPNSQLHIYRGLGHAAYEEAKDFNSKVLNFLAQ